MMCELSLLQNRNVIFIAHITDPNAIKLHFIPDIDVIWNQHESNCRWIQAHGLRPEWRIKWRHTNNTNSFIHSNVIQSLSLVIYQPPQQCYIRIPFVLCVFYFHCFVSYVERNKNSFLNWIMFPSCIANVWNWDFSNWIALKRYVQRESAWPGHKQQENHHFRFIVYPWPIVEPIENLVALHSSFVALAISISFVSSSSSSSLNSNLFHFYAVVTRCLLHIFAFLCKQIETASNE